MLGALLRGLGWLLLLVLVALAVALAVLRFAPNLVWPYVEGAALEAGFELERSDLSVTLWPVSVAVTNLSATAVGQAEPVFKADSLVADVDVIEALDAGAWLGVVADTVEVRPYAVAPSQGAGSDEQVLDLSPLDAVSSVTLTGFRLLPEAGADASLAIDSQLGRDGDGITLSLDGRMAEIDLNLAGRFSRSPKPTLSLTAERLDISPLFAQAPEQADVADAAIDNNDAGSASGFDASALAGGRVELALREAGSTALALELSLDLAALRLQVAVAELIGLREQLPLSDQDLLPLALTANLDGGEDRLAVEGLDARWGPNDLRGIADVRISPLVLDAKLESARLVLPSARAEAVSDNVDAAEEEPGQPLFSAAPLDLGWLREGSVNAELTVGELALLDALFSNVVVRANGSDGQLTLEEFHGGFGDGGFDVGGQLAADGDRLSSSASISVSGVSLEAFGFVPQEELTGGELTSTITLNSAGASPAELAAGLDGRILLTVTDAVVQNDTFELVGSDLLMETLNKINPFVRSDPTTRLDCALVAFEVEQGVLNSRNQLVVETEKMEIVGNGTITLPTEKIDIGISPSARAGVGINVGSLVKFLKIGGTLREPRPAADAAGLLKSGAAIGAAVSTGGVSVLAEGLLKRVANSGSACERALTDASAVDSAPPPSAPQGEALLATPGEP